MIKKALVVFVLFFASFGFAQTSSVVGKWKVVAIDNGEVYYNAKTDSISIVSEDLKEMYADESQIKMLKELMRTGYINSRIEFGENGIFKLQTDLGGTIEAKYKNDIKRDVIIIDSDPGNEEMPYKFIKGLLYFNISSEMSFILEKEK